MNPDSGRPWRGVGGRIVAVATTALLLLIPALWNGSPLFYWDSVDYVYLPFTWELPIYRTVSYGVFTGIGRLAGSLWVVIVAQAVIVAWVLREALAVFWPSGSADRALVPLTLLMVVTTALPWLTGELMPDIFSGIGVLGLAALMFDTGQLGRRRLALAALTTIAIAVHTSNIALGICLFVAFGGIALIGTRFVGNLRPRLGLAAFTLAMAIGLVVGSHWVTVGRPFLVQPTSMLFLSRLVEDGIAKRFLDDHCVDGKPYLLCAYKDRLPPTANSFLWQPNSIPQQLQGWERLAPEAKEIVERSLAEYPLLHLAAAVRLSVQQFAMFRTGDGLLPGVSWYIDDSLRRYYPAGYDAFAGSHQRGGIDFHVLNRLHVPVGVLALLLTLAAFLQASRSGDRRMLALTLFVLLALVGNAVICGALSNPNDRYQSRLVWLAVFASAVAGATLLHQRRLSLALICSGREAEQPATGRRNRHAAATIARDDATMHDNRFRVSLALLAATALAACASGPPPVADRLDPGDIALMQQTAQSALEAGKLGVSVNWENPATGHRGTITPVRTIEEAGAAPCRDYQVTATAGADTAIGYDTACRQAGGVWVSEFSSDPADALRRAERRRRDPYYDDPWCRWPHSPYNDPWCRSRSGVTFGVGARF